MHAGSAVATCAPVTYWLVSNAPDIGYRPQYWYQVADEGTVLSAENTMVAAEHAPLSPLVLLVTVSEGARSNTPQPEKPVPPQSVV